MKKPFSQRGIALLCLLLLSFTIQAQDKIPYVIPRFEGKFQLDGIPNEAGWKAIPSLPVTMFMPTNGGVPTERTEFRVAYDDNFFYAAGWLYDSEPNKIQNYTFKRDDLSSSDWFGLHLDTFADKENALTFYTTPCANRFDGASSNDAQGDNWTGVSWNTFWYCATSRTTEGWFAEYKIPLSSLRYQKHNGQVVMGMMLNRRIARKNEFISYPAVSNQWGPTGMFKASQAQPIVFEHLCQKKPIYVTPYLLAGMSSTPQLNNDHTSYQLQHTPTYNAGLDVKIGLTGNLTADLTINTDFAQVEADDQQANLTRFSLFYPEKRLFFQERASIFNFGFGTNNALFYSRQIGLNNGQRVPILAGGRLVGRVGRWDIGFIDMQTKAITNSDGLPLPSENMSVLRLRRRVFNQNSYVGAMTTTRLGTDGHCNFTYGLDGIFRVVKQNFLAINWAQSFENGLLSQSSLPDAARWRIQYEKRILKGFGYDLSASRVGVAYHPGLGFESRQNYTRFGDRIFWGWLPKKKSSLLNHQLGIYGYVFLRNQNGTTESVEVSPVWDAATKKGHTIQVKWRNAYESLTDALPLLGDIRIAAGKYRFQSLYGLLTTPWSQPLSARFEVEGGQFYNGHRLSASVRPLWSASRYLELSPYFQWNRVWFPGQSQHQDLIIAQLRTRVSLNVKISAEALIQYNSAVHQVSSNIRFRYNPREGNDFFVVFNQGTNTDRLRAEPILPHLSSRILILKYTYTFVR
jgi:hypothetical protein